MLEVVRCCTHWFEFQTASLCSTHSLITMHFVVPVVIHHDKLSFTVLRKQQLLMCVEYIFRITKQEVTSGWTFWENGLSARGKLWSALSWSKLNIAESSYLAASGWTDILNVLACKHHRFALIRFVSTCMCFFVFGDWKVFTDWEVFTDWKVFTDWEVFTDWKVFTDWEVLTDWEVFTVWNCKTQIDSKTKKQFFVFFICTQHLLYICLCSRVCFLDVWPFFQASLLERNDKSNWQ